MYTGLQQQSSACVFARTADGIVAGQGMTHLQTLLSRLSSNVTVQYRIPCTPSTATTAAATTDMLACKCGRQQCWLWCSFNACQLVTVGSRLSV